MQKAYAIHFRHFHVGNNYIRQITFKHIKASLPLLALKPYIPQG